MALENAAEAAGGIVGSASEDRMVLQLLFDRVSSIEQAAQFGPRDEHEPEDEDEIAELPLSPCRKGNASLPPPKFAVYQNAGAHLHARILKRPLFCPFTYLCG